jgi:hypothetical protein
VDVGITGKLSEPFGGVVTLTARQDEMTKMVVSRGFVLVPDLRQEMSFAMKLAFAAQKCELRITDADGRTRKFQEFHLWDYGSGGTLTALGPNDLLVGLVGKAQFGLADLPNHTGSDSGGKLYLKHKLARRLPWDWTGYAGLDVLVLYDPDWSAIKDRQAEAICQWVGNGGRLLVVLGSRPLPPAHPLARLLGVTAGQVRQVTFSREAMSLLLHSALQPATASCRPLALRPGARGWAVSDYDTGVALTAAGPAGFGYVGVMAFDPSSLSAPSGEDLPGSGLHRAGVWAGRLNAVLAAGGRGDGRGVSVTIPAEEDPFGVTFGGDAMSMYEAPLETRAANAVTAHLLSIEELRPLGIWWVILLLLVLALLLGPIDYLLLKKLDRQPLTWITSGAIIILFTVGAWYGVQALRGGRMQVRLVSVVDAVAAPDGAATAWRTTYAGIFASHSGSYALEPLEADQWWSAVSPTEHYLYARGASLASRTIYFSQREGGSLPRPVPINIWSMQCLICEQPTAGVPFTATVARDGETLDVTIENLSERPIREAYVRVGEGMRLTVGEVPAGQAVHRRGRPVDVGPWEAPAADVDMNPWDTYGDMDAAEFLANKQAAYYAWGCRGRTRGIEAYLARGAAVVCAEYADSPAPFGVMGRSSAYQHIQLPRLVVFIKEGSSDD